MEGKRKRDCAESSQSDFLFFSVRAKQAALWTAQNMQGRAAFAHSPRQGRCLPLAGRGIVCLSRCRKDARPLKGREFHFNYDKRSACIHRLENGQDWP